MKFFDAITFGCMLGTAPVMADLEAFKADLKEKAVGLEGFIFDDLCATICYFTSTCRNDPQSHGSYCKIANTPNTCFGLYFQFNILRPFCFQPNDPNCPEQFPVTCGGFRDSSIEAEVAKMVTAEKTIEVTTEPAAVAQPILAATAPEVGLEQFKAELKEKAVGMNGFVFDDFCATLCYFTSTCRNDPQSHGSYCKISNTPNTCFGLYFQFNILRPFCFQPNDPNCPEQFPVRCGSYREAAMEAQLARLVKEETKTDLALAPVPVTPPVVSVAEPQMTLEQYKADVKEKAVGLNGFIFDDLCATICYFTPNCRNDPHSHSSYCKISNTPNVCFGLYFQFNILRPFCFEPNDPNCPEQFPVRCGTFREAAIEGEVAKLITAGKSQSL